MLAIEAALAEGGEAEVAGAVVDEAVAVGHRALLIVLQPRLPVALQDAAAQLGREHVHRLLVAHLQLSGTLGHHALGHVAHLKRVVDVLVQALEAELVVVAGEDARTVRLDRLAVAGRAGLGGRRRNCLLLQLQELQLVDLHRRLVQPPYV